MRRAGQRKDMVSSHPQVLVGAQVGSQCIIPVPARALWNTCDTLPEVAWGSPR